VIKVRHDLRNPLGHILGFSELLLDASRKRGVGTLSPDLKRMLDATEEMVNGVNRALDPALAAATLPLDELDRQIRNFVTLVASIAQRCHPTCVDLGDPFHTDLARITGAAEKLASLTPHLQALRGSGTSTPAPPAEMPPLVDPRSPAGIVQAGPGLRSWKDGAILIVGAEPQIRDPLRGILVQHNYKVLSANSASETIPLLQTQSVDLILLHLAPPIAQAASFIKSLQHDPVSRHIPILTVCSLAESREGVAMLELGADDFIPTPVEPAVLMARTRGALARKRGHDQERAYLQRLQGEQDRSERLLHNIVPAAIARRLKQGDKLVVDECEHCSMVWARVTNFARLADRLSASQLVTTMNDLAARFDLLSSTQGLERSQTHIDSYVVAAGLPVRRADHAQAAAKLALSMQREVAAVRRNGVDLRIHIALSTGALAGAVTGWHRFAYDLWGPAWLQAQKLLIPAESLPGDPIVADHPTHERISAEFKFESKTMEGAGTKPGQTIFLLSARP
jgi:CheY-like chemotaxis protein